MRTRFAIYSGLCFLLLFVVVLFAGRLTSRTGIRLDLAAGDIGTLAPATIRHLRDLDHNLDFTFFVSSRRQMPSHLQQVGPGVRRLLEAMRQIDPDRIDVLFERFVSRERNEPPDIDIDFEHERREEVIQYIYQKYGRDRAGLTATHITYRAKSS